MSDSSTWHMLFSIFFFIVALAFLIFFVSAPKSEKLEAFLNAPETAKSVLSMIFPISGQIRVMDATEMSYTLRIPCRSGWFWQGGKPIKGTLFFVPVPLGYVAKLPGENAVTQMRYSDASSFCIVKDLANQKISRSEQGDGYTKVELLQRSRRWHVVLDGTDHKRIVTQNENPIRGHVAVHTSFDLEVTDPNLGVLFTDHKDYQKSVEFHVISRIRSIANHNTYEWMVTNTQVIVKDLNDTWRKKLEQKLDVLPASLLTTTTFSGVILNLYVELEEARLASVLTQFFSDPELELTNLRNSFEAESQEIESQVSRKLQDLKKATSDLEALPTHLKQTSENMQHSLITTYNNGTFTTACKNAIQTLELICTERISTLQKSITALPPVIVSLRQKQQEILEKRENT